MSRRSLPLIAAGFVLIATVSGGCTRSRIGTIRDRPEAGRSVPSIDPEEVIHRVVQEHNQIRLSKGLPSLTVSSRLQKAASVQAMDMAQRKVMSHKGGDGSSPFERMERTGYRYRRAAENVAYGQFTVEEVMDGWMNSPGHRKNILGSFSQIGVSCATAENGIPYWCVTFGFPER